MTHALKPIQAVDYLLVGHVTDDLLDDGSILSGGTASYSGLTAKALGHSVGIVTACAADKDLSELHNLQFYAQTSDNTTTFRNISTDEGRVQYMYQRAESLNAESIPEIWKSSPIVHLGPIAAEVDPEIYLLFPQSLLCLTLQGWLRGFEEDGKVYPISWPYDHALLKASHAAVISVEDVRGEEDLIEEFAAMCRVLVVTENRLGCRVYWNGDVHHFPAPLRGLVEDTGAGDIFAAAFFHRLYTTRDPWEAARFAVILGANSVSRKRLASIPTPAEIEAAKTELL